jgi:hypothetical protein
MYHSVFIPITLVFKLDRRSRTLKACVYDFLSLEWRVISISDLLKGSSGGEYFFNYLFILAPGARKRYSVKIL